MDKGGNQGKSSKPKKSQEENGGKGGKNQKKNNQVANPNKQQYAAKSNAKENTAPNAQAAKMEDLTDEFLLKQNDQPSNDPQQLQNDLAYWQTRVSFFFNLTVNFRASICKWNWTN